MTANHYRPLDGDELTAWVAERVATKRLDTDHAAFLAVLAATPPGHGNRRPITPSPTLTRLAEHLERVGVLFCFYLTGRRTVGAVKLNAYDPPWDPTEENQP